MNEKQQQLTFDKGITNVPSDAICSDNALEECLGLTYENGEHKVIQKPVIKSGPQLQAGDVLLYVHSYGGIIRYLVKSGSTLKYSYLNGATWTGWTTISGVNPRKIESIGNTIIINATDGTLFYALWLNNAYKSLGSRIPDVSVTFSLTGGSSDIFGTTKYVDLADMLDGKILKYWDVGSGLIMDSLKGNFFKNDKEEDVKAALIGLVTMRLNKVKENNRFAFPFWARYAIRLYDGSYTNISSPFLLLPTVRNNWHIYTCDDDGNEKPMNGGTNGGWAQTNYKPFYATLQYTIGGLTNADYWSDIIAGVDIFLSEEVKTFDMEGQWSAENAIILNGNEESGYIPSVNPLFDSNNPTHMVDTCSPLYTKYNTIEPWNDNAETVEARAAFCKCYYKPTLLSDPEIIDKLMESSVFYKVAEHDINTSSQNYSSLNFHRRTLFNLTTQTRLEHDDYFSRAGIKGEIIKAYNNRLHIGNVRRGFFDGFNSFSYTSYQRQGQQLVTGTIDYYVYISTDSGQRIVHAWKDNSSEIADVWFYYPDPRARRVDIYHHGVLQKSLPLREHPHLNGAYAFIKLPDGTDTPVPDPQTQQPTIVKFDEILEEHVFVSEVNNPWVFTAKGDITTKMGKVIGLATQTMSLGELEHGIHPLSVFGSRGISLLRLKDDGTYVRSDEIQREVALENNPCITETDGPVFFASNRGLMVLTGNTVKCVSEQLAGKSDTPFKTFMQSAFIAYDYRDALLWIFNNNNSTCWIYNIKNGTYSHYDFGTGNTVTNAVNSYPDYLLQIGTTVYSLLERPDINADSTAGTTNTYTCKIVSRPMKFENSLALKSLIRVRNIYQLSPNATIALRVYVSNNLDNWMEIHSLTGMPWKYFKFEYNFTLMRAVDHFDGAVIVTQERRTNKLR